MLRWQEIVGVGGEVRWWAWVESQRRQWKDDGGGIEDGGIVEQRTAVMDAHGEVEHGISVIKRLLFSLLLTSTNMYTLTQSHMWVDH